VTLAELTQGQRSASQVDAFEALLDSRGVVNDIRRFDGQGHAFVADLQATRTAGASHQAWAAFTQFLHTSLRS
jgi:dienelactone hydrolase